MKQVTAGQAVLRQKLSRGLEFFAKLPRCLVGIEACASSHDWARELIRLGPAMKLMPAQPRQERSGRQTRPAWAGTHDLRQEPHVDREHPSLRGRAYFTCLLPCSVTL
jgi:transposase